MFDVNSYCFVILLKIAGCQPNISKNYVQTEITFRHIFFIKYRRFYPKENPISDDVTI